MTTRFLRVPEGVSLLPALRAESAGPAWVHAAGRLAAAELLAADGSALTLLGELVLVSLEGPIGGPLFALVQSCEPLGVRLAAGELVEAVTAAPFDACVVVGEHGAALHAAPATAPSAPARLPTPATPPAAASEPSFARAIAVSAERPSAPSLYSGAQTLGQPIPARLARPQVEEEEEETLAPESGDRVEHFAFGTCEVMKSDGERLHLRLGKNGSIKEIALEMLKVSELPDDGGVGRRFKLERRT